MNKISFFNGFLNNVFDKRSIFKSLGWFKEVKNDFSTQELIENVEQAKGEASAAVYAELLIQNIENLDDEMTLDFFNLLAENYDIESNLLSEALEDFNQNKSHENLSRVIEYSEPKRKELFRRLNSSQSGTIRLVRLREKLMDFLKENENLKRVDNDFVKLFKSWFNPGFLVLKHIDWTTPAHILEKIIEYEAVHEIVSWKDLRDRLEPYDRRCFAFFHPSMQDEPLIFVQVALMEEVPQTIEEVLSPNRKKVKIGNEKSAIFYSISNCQKGLNGISFGNFLIKQVANKIKLEFPNIKDFSTLSPVPGFMKWIEKNNLDLSNRIHDSNFVLSAEGLKSEILDSAIDYFFTSSRYDGLPNDPVSRFHLGNGAILDRINFLGDKSQKALSQAAGLMVNYKYDLENIEKNHEEYFKNKEIITSANIKAYKKRILQTTKVK